MNAGKVIALGIGFGLSAAATAAQAPPASSRPSILVLDLELSGDLGGPELASEHEARIRLESQRLRGDLERIERYQLLEAKPAEATLERLKSQHLYLHDCGGCDLAVGRQLGADFVLVSWVNRISGLILQLTYEIHSVRSERLVRRKTFDFRGDNDNAWSHAVDYMVRDIKAEETSAP